MGAGRGGGHAEPSAPPTPTRPDRSTRNRARALRRALTQAEKRLWLHLRGRRLAGFRFSKQAPIGRYVADFVCLSERLVVEVDGGGHTRKARSDQARDRWLEASGYRIVRFWNNDVLGNIDGVLTVILSALDAGAGPLPNPPPDRGRERRPPAAPPSSGPGEGWGGGPGAESNRVADLPAGEPRDG
ncbi:MAG: endonuclease domain-containing protein [Alphaproteobacteria bacterium]